VAEAPRPVEAAPVPAVVPAEIPAVATPAAVTAAPAVIKPAAPAAAPVQPSLPAETKPAAPVVIPSQMISSPQTAINVESLRKLMAENPGKTPQELALDLIKSSMPKVEASPELVAKSLDVLKSMRGKDMFDEGLANRLSGVVSQAKSENIYAEEQAKIAERTLADRLVIAEKNKKTLEALATRKAKLEDALQRGVKFESFFGKMDTPSKIGTLFALAVGGYAAGYSDTPNYVLKAFNDAIDRDIEAQKKKQDSLVNQYNKVLNDYDAAEKLTRADLFDLSALQAKAINARSEWAKINPAGQQLIGKLEMDAAREREQVAKAQNDADVSAVDAKYAEQEAQARINHLNRMGTGVGRGAAAKPTVGPGATALESFEAITDPKQRQRYIVRAK